MLLLTQIFLCTNGIFPLPLFSWLKKIFCLDIRFHYIAQAGFELAVLLPRLQVCMIMSSFTFFFDDLHFLCSCSCTFQFDFEFLLHLFVSVCICILFICVGQRTTWRSQFSLSVMWVPGIELRSPGLVASTLTHWGNLLACNTQIFVLCFAWNSLCHLDWPRTPSNPPASDSRVLELQVWIIMTHSLNYFFFQRL